MMQAPGGRGGGWVVAQFVLLGLIVVVSFLPPAWPDGAQTVLRVVGLVVVVAGIAFAGWAGRAMGRSLTPYPRPRPDGVLVEDGPFAIVRHPIYLGGLLVCLGISLATSIPPLVLTGVLAVLWGGKASVEERHLRGQFAGYSAYAARVRWRILPRIW